MPDASSEEQPRRDRRGTARRILILVAVIVVASVWPLAGRLASQPQVDAPTRQQCRMWVKEYRTSLLAYWAGADTDGRVAILSRYAREGPRHLDRLIVRGSAGLAGDDLALIEAARRALEDYNAAPARRAAEASQAAVSLVAVAQTLDRLEKSLAR